MKNLYAIFFFLIINCNMLFAEKFISAIDGNWVEPQTWENNTVPSSPDTIIIKHHVSHDNSLKFTPDYYIRIESTGTLCIYDSLITNCDTVLNYGKLICSYLYQAGGYVYNEGIMWLSKGGRITAIDAYCSGRLHSVGAIYSGTISGCVVDIPEPITIKENTDTISSFPIDTIEKFSDEVSFYPNPAKHDIEISYSISQDGYVNLSLHDINGRNIMEIMNKFQKAGQYKFVYDIGHLELGNGMFFLAFSTGEKKIIKKLAVLQ